MKLHIHNHTCDLQVETINNTVKFTYFQGVTQGKSEISEDMSSKHVL